MQHTEHIVNVNSGIFGLRRFEENQRKIGQINVKHDADFD